MFFKNIFSRKSDKTSNVYQNNLVNNNLKAEQIQEEDELAVSVLLNADQKKKIIVELATIEAAEAIKREYSGIDELFEEAAYLIVGSQQGSTSILQRKMKLGYNRAGRIIDMLEVVGIVGPFEGSKPREVKIANEFALEQLLKDLHARDSRLTPNNLNENGINTLTLVELHKIFEDNNIPSLKDFDIDSFYENVPPLWSKAMIQKFVDENSAEINELVEIKYREICQLINNEILRKKQEEQIMQDNVEKEKIKHKLLEQERIRRLHEEARAELIEKGELFNKYSNNGLFRESIPQDIMDKVWNRDGGKCVMCGNHENLEFDHIIPFSRGGATTYRNLQILCKSCNIQKSNKIGNNK